MAKKNSTRTSIEELNESLSSFEQKIENNKRVIYWTVAAIVVIALIILGYVNLVRNPAIQQAKEEIAKADLSLSLGNDSIALRQYLEVADSYSNDPANRANLNAAIILYQQGKYEEAIASLKEYDPSGSVVGPASKSLMGDCYVNLEKYDDALKAFDKAASLAGDNYLYTPIFLMKKATVYRELADYKAEAQTYQTIKDKYPEFAVNYNIDIEKYLIRAQAQAGE